MEIQEFIDSAGKLRGDLLQQAEHYFDDADDAEDAVQETLVKLWMLKDRIADVDKMRHMASVVCRNLSLNMLRDRKTTVPVDKADSVTMRNNPQTRMEERESIYNLRQCITSLSDKHRAILKMRNVENMSYADIARILGTTESSVRGMISKARQELIKKMKGTVL